MFLRILVLAVTALLCSTVGLTNSKGAGPPYAPDQLLVGFRAESSDSERSRALDRAGNYQVLKRYRSRRFPGSALERIYLIELPPGTDLQQARRQLIADPTVEYAHPNYLRFALGAPNDTYFGLQWGLLNDGNNEAYEIHGLHGPDPRLAGTDATVQEAIDLISKLAYSPQPVVVAVLDTGIDRTHPDLMDQMWENEGEIAGNGIDDDGNGYPDDRHGWDFAYNDNDPADGDGHGTHVAGVIGAACDNGIGVCGMAPNALLMALKFLDDTGAGTSVDQIEAIMYAVDNGALVLNNSYGGAGFAQAEYDAIEFARDAGVLFVAAAGNENADTDAVPHYPSSYGLENIVSVAASTPWRDPADFSNFGPLSVDLAAPGDEIISTNPVAGSPGVPETSYQIGSPSGYPAPIPWSGTSMATPAVSAALAMTHGLGADLWPADWDTWTPMQRMEMLIDRLLARSERWPAFTDLTRTGGHLNFANIVSPDTTPPDGVGSALTAHSVDGLRAALRVIAPGDDGAKGRANYYELRYQSGGSLNFETGIPVAGLWTPGMPGQEDTLVVPGLAPGTEYTFGIRAVDKADNPGPVSNPLTIMTAPATPLFSDDMEAGEDGWTSTTWILSTELAHSPTHAWNDSPGGLYPNRSNAILSSPEIPAGGNPANVWFWHRYDIEDGWDFGYVEVRRFVGGGWTGWEEVSSFTGTETDWHQFSFNVPASDMMQIRFRLESDISINADGWLIDDVVVWPSPHPSTLFWQDDFSNADAWLTEGEWGVETACLSDSPGDDYPLNYRASATLLDPLDLSDAGAAEISFDLVSFDYEADYDFLFFEYSLDGTNWRTLFRGTGSGTGVQTLDLSAVAGQPAVHLRFRSLTDYGVGADGACIDDFQVHTAQAADLCPLDPAKTEPGICGCGIPDGGMTCDWIDIEKATNGEDADVPTGPILAVDDTAVFSYVVTNIGDRPLENVSVVDDNGSPMNPGDDFNPAYTGGDTNMDGLLDLGETWTFEASRMVTAGQYTNVAEVSANEADTMQQATDSDPSNHFGSDVTIDIEKATNGEDADAATGPILAVGETAMFTYEVSGGGNRPLENVVVVDDNGTPMDPGDDFNPAFTGGDTNMNGLLDLSETWTFEASRMVTAGQYTNVAEVSGNDPDTAEDVSDSDPSNHFGSGPSINIEKATDGQDADNPPGPVLGVGELVTFTYSVTNTGNRPLENAVVVDDNGTPMNPGDDFNPAFTGGDTNMNGLLDLGETWTFEASRMVTAGQYTNVAEVSGNDPDTLENVADNDPSNHFGSADILLRRGFEDP